MYSLKTLMLSVSGQPSFGSLISVQITQFTQKGMFNIWADVVLHHQVYFSLWPWLVEFASVWVIYTLSDCHFSTTRHLPSLSPPVILLTWPQHAAPSAPSLQSELFSPIDQPGLWLTLLCLMCFWIWWVLEY